jgi:hypothetical protein
MNNHELEDAILNKVSEYLTIYDSAFVHKQSFDYFINHRLTKIIEEEPTIVVPLGDNKFYNVHFGQVFVDKPYIIDENRQIRYILPNEARLRDLTYSSLISVNIRTFQTEKNVNDEIISETNSQDFYKINLARIPMMIGTSKCNLYNKTKEQTLKSGECAYDNGGYFIIKGKERALVSQERINYNIVHVFDQKLNSKFLMVSEIRSMSEETGHSVLIQMKLTNKVDNKILLQIPYVSQEIPLGYIFKAYDFSLKEIVHILDVNLKNDYETYPIIHTIAKNIIRDAETIGTQEKAICYITQFSMHSLSKDRRFYYIHQILNNELFPHLGITSSRNQKGFFLGHMLSKLVFTFVKKRAIDDRDHINNKRLEAAGHLVAELFRTLFKRFVRSMEPQLLKRPDILVVMSRNNIITQGIKHCFSTGNWGIPKSNYIRTGVSQILSRLTYNSFLSHLRRVLIPIGKEGKNTKIRQLHPSQIGYICPFETPEGHCLTADTQILTSDGVTTMPITHYKNPEHQVVTVDIQSGKEYITKTHQYFQVKPEELFKITLINSRSIKASGLHPFLVFNIDNELEWKQSKDLQMTDKLATRPILKTVDDVGSNCKVRILGLVRSLYKSNQPYLIIPDYLDWETVITDLKQFYSVLDSHKKHRKIFINLENIELTSIIPSFIQKRGYIRDYLMGFFCGIDIGEKIIDQNIIRDITCIELKGTFQEKVDLWKDLFKTISLHFQIKWDSITFDDENIMKFYIHLSDANIIEYIDTFGFFYHGEAEKNIFIYRDFLQARTKHPNLEFVDFLSNIRVYNQRITFYPILSMERIPIEMTMDFTTVSDHHNFVANGFVTHNSAGIVKNMTMTTQLSTKLNSVFLRMVLEEIQEINTSFDFESFILDFKGKEYYKVLMDGNWVGSCLSDNVYDIIYNYKK